MRRDYIYQISLLSETAAHSVGIRFVSGSEQIEFFDPNIGVLIFNDREIFVDFFRLLISEYALSGNGAYTEYEQREIQKQQ